MQDNNDMYASEAESAAVIQTDKRTAAEKRLDAMLEARGANEQGADSVAILRGIAVELIGQPAAVPPGWRLVPVEPTLDMLLKGDAARMSVERPTPADATYQAMINAAPACANHIPDAGKMVQAAQPPECRNGCPPQQVCDFCQGVGGKDKTTQPRPWVKLLHDEWQKIDDAHDWRTSLGRLQAACAIEALLRAKNEVKS